MTHGQFPYSRPRRMRRNPLYRRLIAETRLSLDSLIMPYFVREGHGVREEIKSMPGQSRFSPDSFLDELEELVRLGIHAVLLFGIPNEKDEKAVQAWTKDGILQKTLRQVKRHFKDLLVITDLCLCAYMDHGHCGVLTEEGEIDNDRSLEILAQAALAQAEAGSDMIAPSDMMDGRVRFLREKLDQQGFRNLPILSYAAKYASSFYGPFRDAAHSALNCPAGGKIPSDRKSYQMDPANLNEALREIAMDIEEGADMVMVKPALAYLDVLREAANTFRFPLAVYSVSGEYAMIKAAAEKNLLDEKAAVYEIMTGFLRAGSTAIITYYAKEIAAWSHSESRAGFNLPADCEHRAR